jgi:hypothetical protein
MPSAGAAGALPPQLQNISPAMWQQIFNGVPMVGGGS